jgi:hypothetical protein
MSTKHTQRLTWAVVVVLGVAITGIAQAQTAEPRRIATGDWPQFRGRNRRTGMSILRSFLQLRGKLMMHVYQETTP